ncbi:MAG: hypothetical protein LBR49_04060 [Tannerella sp.]|nr:hypothetical protein [Tannerella sp.]
MNKRVFISVFVGIVAIACLAGCGGKNSVDGSIDKIESAIKKIEKNKTSMTEADWKQVNEELEEPCRVLKEALDSDRVGALKKLRITGVMIKFAAIAGEAGLHTAADELGKKLQEKEEE